ncbi:MAG TPA: DUF3093 domain-containing protein [Propionibacterium sp.]|nr:DUF3093 domain-containing protein [Propionibacterium sp.]
MHYRERLTTPPWYWILGVVFGVSTIMAVGFWYGPWVAFAGGLVVTAAITVLLAWFSRTEVAVEPTGIRVGPSLLEWPWVGEVQVLDAATTRERLGVGADARAFVTQRPWLAESVQVTVEDAADPHPYWLISSRRPAQLAAAIETTRQQAAS